MKYIKIALLLFSSLLLANKEVTTLSEIFSEAKVVGNVKYYYIQTDKDKVNAANTSDYANSLGGQLSFDTASIYGLSAGVTFMTTNPFLLGPNTDTSVIGKDNGARGGDAREGFSILGEAHLDYNYKDLAVSVGRKVIKTPLIHAKEVRIIPSAVEGGFADYKNNNLKVELAYLNGFKQRTSDSFVNIVEHALGGQAETESITGSTSGSVFVAGVDYINDSFGVKLYDYYSENFMNSTYVDASYRAKVSDIKLSFSGQYVNQVSIGNSDENLQKTGSLTGAKKLNSNAVGLKLAVNVNDAKISLAYSNVLKSDNDHDSLVLPWDGTPLFTNMITSNDLFQSIYGSAFKADSVYIGGSAGLKIAYSQKLDTMGLDGISTTVSYLNTSNSRFYKDQHDYNIVLAYKHNKDFSLSLKGIWVQNNSTASADGTISQIKLLTQYRAIANYKF